MTERITFATRRAEMAEARADAAGASAPARPGKGGAVMYQPPELTKANAKLAYDQLRERAIQLADLFDAADDAFGGSQDNETVADVLRDLVNGVAIEAIAESLGLYGAPEDAEPAPAKEEP